MHEQYTRRLQKIEAELERWLPAMPQAEWGAEVFPGAGGNISAELLQALAAPGGDLISRGGKRWRPLLMTLVCEALGGGGTALPLAPLVEFCHNASLIHDDIEDNSSLRRGKPAVHLVYGVDAAINSGSFLYFLPLSCIEPWAAGLAAKAGVSQTAARDFKTRVYALWGEYMRKLHLGQAMDIHWHRNFSIMPGVDEYYAMCALKTGCLARFAAALGCCAAGAGNSGLSITHNAAETLETAAEKLGIGFQILDDVKNLTTGIPGKKRGDDIVEGKKSLPVLLFLQRFPQRQDMVSRCFQAARSGGVCAPETEELIAALENAGALTEAAERGRALIAGAREIFTAPDCAGLPLSAEVRPLLAGLIDFIS
jgi:octaprenyl-diphosphate synthase